MKKLHCSFAFGLLLLIALCLGLLFSLPPAAHAGTQSLPPIIPMMATPPLVAPTGGCPGGSGGSAGYCAVQLNDLPWVRGVLIILRWAQGQVTNSVDLGVESNTTPGSYSYANIDTVITGYTSQTCGANLPGGGTPCIVSLADGTSSSSAANANIPLYVMDQPWANTAAPAWQANQTYSALWTVSYNGNFYQAQPATGKCAGGAVPPSTPGVCGWVNFAGNAPLQDMSFSSSFPGTTNPSWPTNGNYNVANPTACGGGQCTDALIATGFPAMWETPILIAKQNWINNIMQHLANAAYHSQVRYLRNSGGSGGENFPRNNTTLQLLVGNNGTNLQDAWVQGVTQLIQGMAAGYPSNATFALQTSISGVGLGLSAANADSMAAAAIANGVQFGAQGLQLSDVTAYQKGNACTDDWCALFATYNNRAAFYELQLFAESDPSCNGVVVSPSSCLPSLLWLAAQLRGSEPLYLEIYSQDYRGAYETFTDSNWTGGYAPSVSYQQLFQQLFWAGAPAPIGAGLAPRTH